MAKTYEVKVDVTMSGSFYIEAESEEEAERIAKEQGVVPADLRNFCHIGTDVVETTESED